MHCCRHTQRQRICAPRLLFIMIEWHKFTAIQQPPERMQLLWRKRAIIKARQHKQMVVSPTIIIIPLILHLILHKMLFTNKHKFNAVDFDFCDLDSQTISMPTQNQSNTNDARTSERPRRSRPHPVTEGEVNAPKKKRRSFSSVDDSLQTIAKEAKAVTELTRSLVEAQLRLVAAEYIPSIEDVATKLRAMPNLTRQETVKAIGMFAGNGAARSTFMTIMEEDREEWLMGFLHGN